MPLGSNPGRERAYQYLRLSVLTDPDMSGTFINEQQIADAVGVSRTPVREAVLMLAAEDLVRLVPNRGAFVAPLSGREIVEVMQVRGMIERWAVQSCLEDGNAPHEAMYEVLEQQRGLLEESSGHEFIECDRKFHMLLVEAAGNSLLERMYEGLRARHVLLGVVALQQSRARRQEVLDEHRAIVDALAAGDRQRCEGAVQTHLDTTRDVLTRG